IQGLDFSQCGDVEQALGSRINELYITLLIEGNQPDANMLYHGLHIAKLDLLFDALLLERFDHFRKRLIQLLKGCSLIFRRKGTRKIRIPDGIEKAGELAVSELYIVDKPIGLVSGQQPQ